MTPRSAGRNLSDWPSKRGPVGCLRLSIYVRRMMREGGDLKWARLLDEMSAIQPALLAELRLVGDDRAKRRRLSRLFEGGRFVVPLDLIEIIVRLAYPDEATRTAHRRRCAQLHREAEAGKNGPLVNPRSVDVELARVAVTDTGEEDGALLDSQPRHRPPGEAMIRLSADDEVVALGDLFLAPYKLSAPTEPVIPPTGPVPRPGHTPMPRSPATTPIGLPQRFATLTRIEPRPADESSTRPRSSRRTSVGVFLGAAILAGVLASEPRVLVGGPAAMLVRPHVGFCARGEVAARDLWLRDEHGAPLSEIVHGQTVTLDPRRNPAGLSYKLVTADDGRTGWADTRYIRPTCN